MTEGIAEAEVVFARYACDVSEAWESEPRPNIDEELSARLLALGKISASVAHEINNPLFYVMGNLEHLRLELVARGGNEDLIEAIDDALHGVETMKKIVADLKSFAQRDEAEDDDRAEVDVRGVFESSLKMALPMIKSRARVVDDLRDVPSVLGDERRLGQVFLNLLVNAAQAMAKPRPGGHEIRVSTQVDEGNRVVVEVTDTGEGMSEETRAQIFDPFFTTKKAGGGTGLGLPLCRGIVEAYGGEITVESVLGKGTSFRVILPVNEREISRVTIKRVFPLLGSRVLAK